MIAARENPFRSAGVESLAFCFESDGMDEVLTRLESIGRRGVLVGAEGTGKTTLLETIARQVSHQGQSVVWLRLRRDPHENRVRLNQFFASPVAGSMVCLDGLEQLGWWTWQRVRRHTTGATYLVATSHRPGRLPILRRHVTSPPLLIKLAQQLAAESIIDAEALWRQHQGNLRLCLRTLYDRCAEGELERR